MSKRLKITLIICAVLAVVGAGLCTIGLFVSGFDVNLRNKNLELVEKSFDTDFSEISVNVRSDSVKIFPVEGNKITIKYYDEDDKYYDVEASSDTLSIKRNSVRRRWYEYINIAFVNTDKSVEIGIPSGFNGSIAAKLSSGSFEISDVRLEEFLDVKLSSGSVDIIDVYCGGSVAASSSSGSVFASGLEAGGEVSLSSTSGSAKCEDISCESLRLESTSGSVRVHDGSVKGDVYLKSTSGSAKCENTSAGGEISAGCTSGSVRVTESSAESFALSSVSGSVKLLDSEYTESAELSATSGSVTANFNDRMENYTIISGSRLGGNNLPTSYTSGPKKLNVSTTSGSIHVDFAN